MTSPPRIVLRKSLGGPFIGPNGGKWADAKHTIAWHPDDPHGAAAIHAKHPMMGTSQAHEIYKKAGGTLSRQEWRPHFVAAFTASGNKLPQPTSAPKPWVSSAPANQAKPWSKPVSTSQPATVTPANVTIYGKKPPEQAGALNGVAFEPVADPEFWQAHQDVDVGEPPLTPSVDADGEPKRAASGVVMVEPDGRVWLVEPTNHYGGYRQTMPKGGVDDGLTPQQNALKEAYEESGLQAQITGWIGDFDGDTSTTRYYLAARTGGQPWDAGWETHAVKLASPADAALLLNRRRDRDVLNAALVKMGKPPIPDTQVTSWAPAKPSWAGQIQTALAGILSPPLDAMAKAVPDVLAAEKRRIHERLKWRGMWISIENPQGSTRHWYNPDNGTSGVQVMHYAYGYFRRTEDGDGEHADVYVGPHPDTAAQVYVVRQTQAPAYKTFDENKVMVGFGSAADARMAYLGQYNDPRFFGRIDAYQADEFAAFLREHGEVPDTPAQGAPLMKSIPTILIRGTTPVHDDLEKSVGPYIGPHGGQWADPQHTIPWHPDDPHAAHAIAKHFPHLKTTGAHKLYQSWGGHWEHSKWQHKHIAAVKAAKAAVAAAQGGGALHAMPVHAPTPAQVAAPVVVAVTPTQNPSQVTVSSEADLAVLPAGTSVAQGSMYYVKQANGSWLDDLGSKAHPSDIIALHGILSVIPAPAQTPTTAPHPLVGQKVSSQAEFFALPVGAVIDVNGILTTKLLNGSWSHPGAGYPGSQAATWFGTNSVVHSLPATTPASVIGKTVADLDAMAVGATVLTPGGTTFTKNSAGGWESSYSGAIWTPQQIENAYTHPTAPAQTPTPQAATVPAVGHQPGLTDIDALYAKHGATKGGAALAHKEHLAAGGTIGAAMAASGKHGQGAWYHLWQKAKAKAAVGATPPVTTPQQAVASQPAAPSLPVLGVPVSATEAAALPVGSVMMMNGIPIAKTASGYQNMLSGLNSTAQMVPSSVQFTPIHHGTGVPVSTSTIKPAGAAVGGSFTPVMAPKLPIGTVVHDGMGASNPKLVKIGHDKWVSLNGTVYSDAFAASGVPLIDALPSHIPVDSAGATPATTAPAVPTTSPTATVKSAADLDAMAVGTVMVEPASGAQWTKLPSGMWEDDAGGILAPLQLGGHVYEVQSASPTPAAAALAPGVALTPTPPSAPGPTADVAKLAAKYGNVKGGVALAHKEHLAAGGTIGANMAAAGKHGQGAWYHTFKAAVAAHKAVQSALVGAAAAAPATTPASAGLVVGHVLSNAAAAPIGTVVISRSGDEYTKIGNNHWEDSTLPGSHYEDDGLGDTTVTSLPPALPSVTTPTTPPPAATPPAVAGGYSHAIGVQISSKQHADSLPVGAVLIDFGSFYTKQRNGLWAESPSSHQYTSNAVIGDYLYSLPASAQPAPVQPAMSVQAVAPAAAATGSPIIKKTTKKLGAFIPKNLTAKHALPDGSVIETANGKYQKEIGTSTWKKLDAAGKPTGTSVYPGGAATLLHVGVQSTAKVGAKSTVVVANWAPIGTTIAKDGVTYTKKAHNEWVAPSGALHKAATLSGGKFTHVPYADNFATMPASSGPSGASTPPIVVPGASIGGSTATGSTGSLTVGGVVIPPIAASAPLGTELKTPANEKFVKVAANEWQSLKTHKLLKDTDFASGTSTITTMGSGSAPKLWAGEGKLTHAMIAGLDKATSTVTLTNGATKVLDLGMAGGIRTTGLNKHDFLTLRTWQLQAGYHTFAALAPAAAQQKAEKEWKDFDQTQVAAAAQAQAQPFDGAAAKAKWKASQLAQDHASFKAFGARFNSQLAALSPAETAAIKHHTGSGYGAFNKAMLVGQMSSTTAQEIKHLKAGLDKIKLPPPPVSVNRKVGKTHYEYGDHPLWSAIKTGALVPGFEYSDNAFCSTSVNEGVWSGQIWMEIVCPPGTRGLYVGPSDGRPTLSHYSGECEYLLNSGQKMKVTGYRIENGQHHVTLEVQVAP